MVLNALLIAFAILGDSSTAPAPRKAPMRPVKASAVALTTADKAKLKGDWLLPANPDKKFPRTGAVILVHGNESDRSELWELQNKLASWGAAVMVVDLRGHGESPVAKKGAEETLETRLNQYQEDIKSAVAYARKQKSIDPNRISILGVDLGAVAAIRYAGNDLQIKGVGFVSPETKIENFDLEVEAKKLRSRNLMLLAPIAVKESMEAMKAKLGSMLELRTIIADGEASGANLLNIRKSTDPNLTLELELKLWFRDLGSLSPGP